MRVEAENSLGSVAGEDVTLHTRGSAVVPEEEMGKKCPKGKVKRHGKCVKKTKPHHKKHHSKHSRGGGNG